MKNKHRRLDKHEFYAIFDHKNKIIKEINMENGESIPMLFKSIKNSSAVLFEQETIGIVKIVRVE